MEARTAFTQHSIEQPVRLAPIAQGPSPRRIWYAEMAGLLKGRVVVFRSGNGEIIPAAVARVAGTLKLSPKIPGSYS